MLCLAVVSLNLLVGLAESPLLRLVGLALALIEHPAEEALLGTASWPALHLGFEARIRQGLELVPESIQPVIQQLIFAVHRCVRNLIVLSELPLSPQG